MVGHVIKHKCLTIRHAHRTHIRCSWWFILCRLLSHSELAPLRVPLVPMEHCTSRFFQECDADKDKQVSFKEWTSCFGIKNGESSSTSFTDTDKITLHNIQYVTNIRLFN